MKPQPGSDYCKRHRPLTNPVYAITDDALRQCDRILIDHGVSAVELTKQIARVKAIREAPPRL